MIARALLAIALLGAASSVAAAPCAPRDEAAVVGTVQSMYDAAMRDDAASLRAIFTPDFYAFDVGQRFDGAALANRVKTAHAAGRIFRWKVTQPDIRIACDMASIAFVNDGAVGDAKAMTPASWLASATLRYEKGRWRVAFLHQTRVAPGS